MADIGALFSGLAQGAATGIGLAQNAQRIRQQQQVIDLEAQKQDFTISQLRASMADAQSQAQALAGITQNEEADSHMFGVLSNARDLAGMPPSLRKTQLPVFAANFKKMTGQDLAPNVMEAFAKGDTATLTRLLDNATQTVLNDNGTAQEVISLLSDPTRSAAWLASQTAAMGEADGEVQTEAPADTAMQAQIGALNRSAAYAQQKVDALTARLPTMRTAEGVKALNEQILNYQKQATTLQAKVAELSKPVVLGRKAQLVGPDGQVIAENASSDLKSQAEMDQAVDLAGRKAAAATRARFENNPIYNSAQLSGDALDRAAAAYNIDGRLPSVGMGAQGWLARKQIMERAAEMSAASGETGQSAAIRAAIQKNTLAANSQMQAQEQKLSAFERTAIKNADLALAASQKLDRLGIPFADKVIIATKKNASDNPDVARLQLFTLGFRNEFARIVTGATGVTTDTARREVDDVLRTYMGKMSFAAAINAAKQEMTNRIVGYREQNASVREQLAEGTSAATPAIARPNSKEEYDALPEGTPYIAPDGKRYFKGQ